MSPTAVKPRTKTKQATQRPPLWKVILLNDDFTPREFVVQVLKAVFRLNESQAYRVMMTAHQKGACVIAVYTRDVAETKAKEATELGKAKVIRCILRPRRKNNTLNAARSDLRFNANGGLLAVNRCRLAPPRYLCRGRTAGVLPCRTGDKPFASALSSAATSRSTGVRPP